MHSKTKLNTASNYQKDLINSQKRRKKVNAVSSKLHLLVSNFPSKLNADCVKTAISVWMVIGYAKVW